MKKLILILFVLLISCGCQQQSHIKTDTVELWGHSADVYAQQLSDNIKTTQSRFSDLFKYNDECFVALFIIMLGGVAFTILTRSKWGWVIPVVSGAGLAALLFITQAVEYIGWVTLTVVVLSFIFLIWKAYQYQTERNIAIKQLETK